MLKAFQGSTGPFTQLLGSLFLQAAVADLLLVAFSMQHGQNQRWDNITQTLHNNLGNLLPSTMSSTEILEARLSSKPASGWHTHPVPHSSPSLHQHLSACLSNTHLYSPHLGQWMDRGLLAPQWQGQNSFFLTVERFSWDCLYTSDT